MVNVVDVKVAVAANVVAAGVVVAVELLEAEVVAQLWQRQLCYLWC